MRLTMGPENVIVRGTRPEDGLWGPYQFPRPYRLKDRIVVSVDIHDDDLNYGDPKLWFESRDEGLTWNQIDGSVAPECGLELPNGDRLFFPMQSAIPMDGYAMADQTLLTPGYDFNAKAGEGTLPIPDGTTAWINGQVIKAYRAERLPESLAKKEWTAERIPVGEKNPRMESVPLDWPFLTRVVHIQPDGKRFMKGLFPRGNPKIGPDGAVWVTAFSGEGHIDPENGQYSPYYSAELFRSEDNGHSFRQHAHLEYPADGRKYPYLSGGFSDSDIEFMPDGSMVWFLRSAWYMSTGNEAAPMYFSRSEDMGRTWSAPEPFAPTGVLPRLCRLNSGIVMLCYARPGIFVRACDDPSGRQWSEPLAVMTPEDRSALANRIRKPPRFHDWDGSCCNPELLPLDERSALLFYTDFYYPDETGAARKTVLCRKITAA